MTRVRKPEQLKVIVAGSRTWDDWETMESILDAWKPRIKEIVSGNARGADEMGEWWASKNEVQLKVVPANWSRHGRAAGHIRNKEMAEYADGLILFWDGKSPGSRNMLNLAKQRRLVIHEVLK